MTRLCALLVLLSAATARADTGTPATIRPDTPIRLSLSAGPGTADLGAPAAFVAPLPSRLLPAASAVAGRSGFDSEADGIPRLEATPTMVPLAAELLGPPDPRSELPALFPPRDEPYPAVHPLPCALREPNRRWSGRLGIRPQP